MRKLKGGKKIFEEILVETIPDLMFHEFTHSRNSMDLYIR